MIIKHNIKIAIRNLWKYKTQNIISIIGLAVGLLCFCICMYCCRFLLDIDRCFLNHEHIFQLKLHNEQTGNTFSGTPIPLAEELRSRSMNNVIAITSTTYPRKRPFYVEVSQGKLLPYELETIEVDTFYNQVFTPELIAGGWKTVSQKSNAIVMSQSTAIRIFGTTAEAVGKQLTLMKRLTTSPKKTPKTGGVVYTVIAVMKDIPLNNSLDFMAQIDLLTINDSEGLMQSPKRYEMTGANTYVLLPKHTNIRKLEEQFVERHYTYTLYNEPHSVIVHRMDDSKGNLVLGGITGIVGTLILLVGLINFFHFLIGSFLNRSKEHSIMKVIGCNGWQLFSLLFTQSLIVVILSSFLVLWGLEILDKRMDFTFPGVMMTFDTTLLIHHALQYMIFLIGLSALVCAFVSVRIRKISAQAGICGSNKRRGKQRGRNLMLGMQFFICWIFVALSASLILQSEKTTHTLFQTLSQKEKAEILSVPLDYDFMKQEEKLGMIERFKQHAGVKEILLSDINYLRGVSGNGMMTEKDNENSWMDINIMSVPSNFFSFMNILIEQGRGLCTKGDIVVDRTWQLAQNKNVIGISLHDSNNDYTVNGICTSFQADVYNKSHGFAFLPYDSTVYVGHCYIKCHPEQQKEVIKWIEKVYSEMLPENISYQVRTFIDDIHEKQGIEYNLKNIILFFAVVSILITLLGVYSSITLDTERRQKEIAIRKVNGASMSQIILLFTRLYIILVGISAAIAFPLIYLILILWKRMYIVFFNYGFMFWISIFMIVVLITAFTIFFRILKISRVNPALIIKNE